MGSRVGSEGLTLFVGRERERGGIGAALEGVRSGRGRLVLVHGEPGVGKTRLVEICGGDAETRGFVTSWGKSLDAAGTPAYGPWTQLLRSLRDQLGSRGEGKTLSSSREFLARILPEVAPEEGSPEDAVAAMESPDARFRLFESVTSYLAGLASRRPLMLVLEDLHAADVPSLLLLQFAARELRHTPIVLVGTYREPGPWLDEERRGILARTSGEATTLSLHGLTELDVSRLADALLEGDMPAGLAKDLHEATAGNALLVEGALRMLEGREGASGRLTLPRGVRESIRGWIGYLSPRSRDVVEAAAVIGEELSLGRVAELTGISLEQIDEHLEEARRRGLVSRPRRSPMRARFRHGLIRETLYEDLDDGARRELHRKTAEMLESGPEAADAAELAHHFLRAVPAPGAAEQAFTYAREAARRSLDRLAWEDAVHQLRNALAALELAGDDPPRRCETLIDLAGALGKAGDFARSRATFADAFVLARHLDATHLMARAAIGHYGPVGQAGNDPETNALVQQVLPRLADDDHGLRALLSARLALSGLRGEVAARTVELVPRALEAARRSGDPAVLAETLMTVWPIVGDDPDSPYWTFGETTAAAELTELGIREGNRDWEQWGRVYRFAEVLEEADLAAAETEARGVARVAGELRQPFWLFGAAVLRTILVGIAGRFEECLTLVDEAEHQGRGTAGFADVLCGFQRAFVGLELDRLEHVEPMIRFLMSNERSLDRAGVVYLLWEKGDRERARHEFAELATEGFSSFRFQVDWGGATAVLAPVCADLDDAARAAELYEILLPYAKRVLRAGTPGYWALGPGARFLGIHATTMGRYEDAAHHFAVAREISRRMNALPWIAWTSYDEARLALRRGRREEAASRLAEAEEIVCDLGMKRLLRKIGELRS